MASSIFFGNSQFASEAQSLECHAQVHGPSLAAAFKGGATMEEIMGAKSLKQKIISELIEYWIVVAYLLCFFGVFAWYGRLILAEYEISYLQYGVILIESLVLAKVILIGEALRLGRGFEDKPLIVPTLYKAVLFTLFVGLFSVVEKTVQGLLHGRGWAAGIEEIVSKGKYELLAKSLVTFVAFIPFFAFTELERVLGKGQIFTPFFRRTAATTSDLSK
jgi:hypothetical protein